MLGHGHRDFRIDANELCVVVRENGTFIGGVLVDISDNGFCIDCNHNLDVGESVQIRTVGLGRILGTVRWSDGKRAGGVLQPYLGGACASSVLD